MIKTDWERYYSNPVPTCCWSRAIVRRHLLKMIQMTGMTSGALVAELGGGGSCFCNAVQTKFGVKDYTVYDSCPSGITEFLRKHPENQTVQGDLLQLKGKPVYDLVFSVGLIEHFSPEDTKKIIQQHFELTKPGGHVIIFFPTPALLYRLTRTIAECCGLWQFPDERPLQKREVKHCADAFGICLAGHTIYANFLTQYATIYRKTDR